MTKSDAHPRKINSSLKIHWIGTFSKKERKVRLFRITWATGDNPLIKGWHSSSLSISLWSKLFNYTPELWGWAITILFLRVHRKRAYGGWL